MSAAASISCEHCNLPVPAARRRRGGEAARFCCFGCRIGHDLSRVGAPGRGAPGTTGEGGALGDALLVRLGAGVFLAMNLMVFNWFFYAQQIYEPAAPAPLAGLFAYGLMLLCTLVIVLLGAPLASDARAGVNVLILLGVAAAYALSVVNTVRGQGHLYYDTAAMILVLVTLGGYLDGRAKRKAALTGDTLLASLPRRIWVRRGSQVEESAAEALCVGDVVRVRPGETVPADGAVDDGRSHVDESALTGESRPRLVEPGSAVLAGAVNVDGQLWVRAAAVGHQRVIEHVRRLLDEARRQQPAAQRVADRVAAVFVPAVVALAIAVFTFHAWRGDGGRGLFDALSVLLISCPCALGLAAPLACYSAITRAARCGVLIDSPATLERAAAVRTVLFDKTGTLTHARMTVEAVATAADVSPTQALALAAAIESASQHPIAAALSGEAARRGLPAAAVVTASRVLPGRGVEASVAGRMHWLGNAQLLADRGLAGDALVANRDDQCGPQRDESQAGADVYLCDDTRVLARFTLNDPHRPDAVQAIGALRSAGLDVAVLTGDQPGPARRLGDALGVEVIPQMMPADKLAHVTQRRQRDRRPIAFVGDGINDAPALAAADVGVAVGSATDLARQAGHVHLVGDDLGRVPVLLAIARDTVLRIRLSLAWALGYNAVGLAMAAAGLLTPIFAASAMVVSSLLIVTIASRAGRAACQPHHDSSARPESATETSGAAPAVALEVAST